MEEEIISKEVFDRESKICRQMNREKGGCAWGECDACGVIPLLFKLHKGELLEGKAEIEAAKNQVFN
jgi:xanthine dehydrogenase iron-sulfur cluster and FAD-binding subunit A